MGRQAKRTMVVTAGLALLLVVGGVARAEGFRPSAGAGWTTVLLDDLGRAFDFLLRRSIGHSESEPAPPTEPPEPASDADSMTSEEEPLDDRPEMGPMINPDG